MRATMDSDRNLLNGRVWLTTAMALSFFYRLITMQLRTLRMQRHVVLTDGEEQREC
jgi:hypothetical protein